MDTGGAVVLAIVDAALVALFFLFRVLPWAEPGPWRTIWVTAVLAASLFSLGEAAALVHGGEAISFEVQGPLFGAILATTVCFILVYLNGTRIGERALALALTDDLTQLLNSRSFNGRLEERLKLSDAFAVACIKLDGLGLVNDLLGMHRGDSVLRAFADILRQHATGADVVARLGGDQFALVVVGSDEHAKDVTRQIAADFRALAIREVPGIDIVAQVGIASRTEASDPGRLVRLAYRGMQRAASVDTVPDVP